MSPARKSGAKMPTKATKATKATKTARIIGEPVAPLVPARGPVHVLLVGEAPGPRGADKSGFPFFGDAAGKPLYDTLRGIGAITVPELVDALPWDGTAFRDAGLAPVAHGIALGNAYDRCPTDDFVSFRAPSRRELTSEENVARLVGELRRFAKRGLVGIVTMGRVAATTIDYVLAHAPDGSLPAFERRHVVHPSSRGLLSLVPNRGSGVKLVELQARWAVLLATAVREAGYPE